MISTHTRTAAVAPVARITPVVRPFNPSRIRWTRIALVVMGPIIMASSMYAHIDKPVLEDNIQWVKVQVEQGYGYDTAIKAAYTQVGEYDITQVDIRDLRDIAMHHNKDKALYAGTVIEVPVYTGTGKYR